MKKTYKTRHIFLQVFILIFAVTFTSCIKDTDGSPETTAGNPSLESITPEEGSGGALVTIKGSGLGDIRSIVFDLNDVPAGVTPTLNTESSILFRVPDTAFGGPQKIILTNSDGKTLEASFNVIALPIVSSAFPSDFQAGSTISLTGNNLDDVSSVVIDGTTDEATIVSQTRKSMVITMPASSVISGKLKLTNVSGTLVTTKVFINIDQAAQVFTDAFNNGFESWSWGGTYESSTDYSITGTSSLKAAFDAGGWGGLQLGNGGSLDVTGCKNFAFWVKGAAEDQNIQVIINWANDWVPFTVPAEVWTYFSFDYATTWPGAGNSVNNVTFQIMGADKTVYFDNIVFIK
ncbi:MAG: IPT/TIG domain-containing protein [Bacteroidales bacterium]|nr:IPT/TIG domain-containing protein [Bacteroidales bacterium]